MVSYAKTRHGCNRTIASSASGVAPHGSLRSGILPSRAVATRRVGRVKVIVISPVLYSRYADSGSHEEMLSPVTVPTGTSPFLAR